MNLDRFIIETVHRQLLVESAINNSRDAARKMVIARFGCTEEYANDVVEEIRGHVGLEDKMRKFLKGCTRMYLNGELRDPQVLNDFKVALNKIKTDGHIGEFDSDLRRFDQPEGTLNSAKDVIGFFKDEIDSERAEQRQKVLGRTFEPKKDYKIVKINSFEEASVYSDYTSWCVTSNESDYNSYTNNGLNQFYFCLKKGFKRVKDNGDNNDTKDKYALSMLAILVNPEGDLIHCTNRKNNDQNTLNPEEISELVGYNFYETFKPNTIWLDALEDTKKQLDNGVPVEKVFDEVRREGDLVLVCLLKRWNILGEGNTFLRESWYDFVGYFSEGFAMVFDSINGFNFINRDGKEICDRWYDDAYHFSEGFAAVCDENKGWNFVSREGKELCDRWYYYVDDFHEGFAIVEDEYKGRTFINHDGKEVFGRWYDGACRFSEGFAMVRDYNKGMNFINRDGKEICDRWFDRTLSFSEGFAWVMYKGKLYWLRKDGVLCDFETKEPIEDGPTQMAESLINRLVRDVLIENRKRYYL